VGKGETGGKLYHRHWKVRGREVEEKERRGVQYSLNCTHGGTGLATNKGICWTKSESSRSGLRKGTGNYSDLQRFCPRRRREIFFLLNASGVN